MDLGTKTANDLLSKDLNVAYAACDNLINHKDLNSFKKLVDCADFIFPFIKEKINNNLLKRINSSNFRNIVSFMSLYSPDFEDFIVGGLVKFASQDLTDEIYDILENGSDDEKIYCCLYFSKINDEIALDLLNKYAMSDNEILAQSAAKALSSFNDKELFDKSLQIISNSNSCDNDFIDNVKYFNFLINYGDQSVLPLLFKYLKKTSFSSFMLPDLLSLVSYGDLIEEGNEDIAYKIYLENLNAYPEFLSLSTAEQYEILDIIMYIMESENISPFMSLLILKTKYKFTLFQSDDIYKLELNKNEKQYLKDIYEYIESKDEDFYSKNIQNLKDLFNNDETEILTELLNAIIEMKLSCYGEDILNLIEKSQSEIVISEALKALKALYMLNNVDKKRALEKIKNDNLRIITQSYFD